MTGLDQSVVDTVAIAGAVEAMTPGGITFTGGAAAIGNFLAVIGQDFSHLEGRLRDVTQRFAGQQPPRPAEWGGYCLQPERVEFWQGRPDRLHDRLDYRLHDGHWQFNAASDARLIRGLVALLLARVNGLSSLLEPLIIVVLGGLIGGILVAMYLPIFRLGQVF